MQASLKCVCGMFLSTSFSVLTLELLGIKYCPLDSFGWREKSSVPQEHTENCLKTKRIIAAIHSASLLNLSDSKALTSAFKSAL